MSTKALKKELLAAVVMLLVAAVALSGSTYAWFANNTQVTAKTITATAQSTELLRIARNNILTGAGSYSTTIELSDLDTDAFVPVSAGTDLIKAGNLFKVAQWENETVTATADVHQLAQKYLKATEGTDYAVGDIWLTDNNAANVYFSSKTNIIAKTCVVDTTPDPDVEYGVYAQFIAGSGITTITLATGTALTFDANTGAISNTPVADVVGVTDLAKTKLQNALGALRLTFVPYATTTAGSATNNANDSTASGAAPVFYTLTAANTNGAYNTQNGTTGTNVDADKRISACAATASVSETATLESDATQVISNTVQMTQLNANDAKHFKVYCYLEGCDKQCITGIADKVSYIVSLGFSQASGQ
jgi:hypothetical protein